MSDVLRQIMYLFKNRKMAILCSTLFATLVAILFAIMFATWFDFLSALLCDVLFANLLAVNFAILIAVLIGIVVVLRVQICYERFVFERINPTIFPFCKLFQNILPHQSDVQKNLERLKELALTLLALSTKCIH